MVQFFRLFARLLIHAAGLYASIPVGLMLGLLLEGILLSPTVAPDLTGIPHMSTWIFSAIVGGLIGGILIEGDRSEKGYYITIAIRTLVATAWWPMLRLVWIHPHPLTSLLLCGLAVMLLAAAVLVMIGLYFGSRRADFFAYVLASLAFLGYGVFLQGDHVLALTRTGDSVDGTLRTLRWCGMIKTDRIELRGITGSQHKFQSDAFDNILGDGTVLLTQSQPVLVAESPVYYTSLGHQFSERFDEIESGTINSLTLRAPIPFLRLHWTFFIAGALFLVGLYGDPVAQENRAVQPMVADKVGGLHLGKWLRLAAVLGVLGGLGWGAFAVINFSSKQTRQLEQIRQIAGFADLGDLEVDGKPLVGNIWMVNVTRPDFGDEELEQLMPLLSESHGLDLDLSQTEVSDKGIQKLRWLDSVFALRLRGTSITSAALDTIGYVKPMVLDLRETSIRADDLPQLEAPTLQYLMFSDPGFDRGDFAQLFRFDRLTHVRIEQAKISQAHLDFWSLELADLTLSGFEIVGDEQGDQQAAADAEATVADGPVTDGPIVDAIRRYCAAIGQRDAYTIKSLWDTEHPTNVRDLVGLEEWWSMRPVSVSQFSGTIQSGVATVKIYGDTEDGSVVEWEFELIQENGRWKVRSERWPR